MRSMKPNPLNINPVWQMVLFVVMVIWTSSFVQAARFTVANDGEVGAYFVGASAAYENKMTANFSDFTLDAPFISNRSPIGEYFSFGQHEAGASVVIVDHVVNTNNWFYSLTDFNDDNLPHIQYSSFTLNDGTPILIVGFEDILGLGDRDFNDNVVMFTNVMSAVPEPETYLLLLIGLSFLFGIYHVFNRPDAPCAALIEEANKLRDKDNGTS